MTVDIRASYTEKTSVLNGFEAIEAELLAEPLAERYAIVRVISPTFKRNNIAGTSTPQVQLVAIEPMRTGSDVETARQLYQLAFKARVGHAPDEPLPLPRPIDGEQELPLDGTPPEGADDSPWPGDADFSDSQK